MSALNDQEMMNRLEEAWAEVEAGTIEFLNEAANRVYDQSQIEVPKSGNAQDSNRHGETLAESGRAPRNDPELAAGPGKPEATVMYAHPAAVAQHEGEMIYTNKRGGKVIDWKVQHYTTPGTKKKYLEDPGKAMIASAEALLAEDIGLAVEGKFRLGGV